MTYFIYKMKTSQGHGWNVREEEYSSWEES